MIYLDANVIIRLIEGAPATIAPLNARVAGYRGLPRAFHTSRLSRLECRVLPLRNNDVATLALFDAFFVRVEVAIHDVTPAVIETATDLRAKYRFKTPDSLHLATAVLTGATAFLTGDAGLAKCTEVPVEVL